MMFGICFCFCIFLILLYFSYVFESDYLYLNQFRFFDCEELENLILSDLRGKEKKREIL